MFWNQNLHGQSCVSWPFLLMRAIQCWTYCFCFLLHLYLFLFLFICFIVRIIISANIALNKSTYISSQYAQFTGSEKAVDGGKTPTFFGRQCAISFGGQTALWRVDLGYLSSIHHIIIYPRTENNPWSK